MDRYLILKSALFGLPKKIFDLAFILAVSYHAKFFIRVLSLSLIPQFLLAADTLETWDKGASDLDFAVGAIGLGHANPADRAYWTDITLGYGIAPGFSAYLGSHLHGDGGLRNASHTPYLGLFGSPIDTDHFDFDLIADFGFNAQGAQTLCINPGFEINLDLQPELALAGLFLTGSLALGPRDPDLRPQDLTAGLLDNLSLSLGAYWSLSPSQQILLQADMVQSLCPRALDQGVLLDAVALGYNVVLFENFEAITEFSVSPTVTHGLPQLALLLGFTAGLPNRAAP